LKPKLLKLITIKLLTFYTKPSICVLWFKNTFCVFPLLLKTDLDLIFRRLNRPILDIFYNNVDVYRSVEHSSLLASSSEQTNSADQSDLTATTQSVRGFQPYRSTDGSSVQRSLFPLRPLVYSGYSVPSERSSSFALPRFRSEP